MAPSGWHEARARGLRPSLRVGALAAGLALGISLPVRAAESPSGAQTDPAHADAAQRGAAQKTFEAGSSLYEKGRYEEALSAFRVSLSLVSSPNSRLMIARCLRELGRLEEARAEFITTISEAEASGGRYAETATAARAESQALPAGPGPTSTPPDAAVPTPAPAPEPTPAAQPTPAAAQPAEPETAAAPPMPAASQPPHPVASDASLRTAAYVSGGVGLVGLGIFAVFGAKSAARYGDLERECVASRCAADRRTDIDRGRREQVIANVGLGVGLVGVALGATLFVLSPSDTQAAPSSLAAVVGPGSAALTGRF